MCACVRARTCVCVCERESVDIGESGRVCACKRSACVNVGLHDSQIETATAT